MFVGLRVWWIGLARLVKPRRLEGMQDDTFFQEHKVGGFLSDIFDDLAGFVYFVKDVELRYVAFNSRLNEIFDIENGREILGQKDDAFMPPHLVEEIRKDDLKILKTGESMVNRVELVPRGNGFVDWSTTTKKPLRDEAGNICGIVGVTRPFSQGTTSLFKNEELADALEIIHETFRQNVPIVELASSVHLSLSSFLRKFKACFNMTPKEYIRHLRVQEACHQIVQSTMSFAEISYECGFSDQSHFSREFSKIMKESPSSYRSRYKMK